MLGLYIPLCRTGFSRNSWGSGAVSAVHWSEGRARKPWEHCRVLQCIGVYKSGIRYSGSGHLLCSLV